MNMVVAISYQGTRHPVATPESDTHIMSTGLGAPLEDAFRIAQADLVGCLAANHGLAVMDAYELVSQAVEVAARQRLRHELHVVAKTARSGLPARQGPFSMCTRTCATSRRSTWGAVTGVAAA